MRATGEFTCCRPVRLLTSSTDAIAPLLQLRTECFLLVTTVERNASRAFSIRAVATSSLLAGALLLTRALLKACQVSFSRVSKLLDIAGVSHFEFPGWSDPELTTGCNSSAVPALSCMRVSPDCSVHNCNGHGYSND